MSPDVTLIVAAFRSDHVHHSQARRWLAQARGDCAEGRETLVLLPVVVAGFLRLVTNRRVFTTPDSIEAAIAFIDAVLESPGAQLRVALEEWPILRAQLLTLNLAGNLVTDASIAASIQALGEHLVTFDGDFRRLLPRQNLTVLGSPK